MTTPEQAVLTRDNVSFLLQGVPCMYRELLFSVKSAGGECRDLT